MAIRYHCRHCETEIGSLPFESAEVVLNLLEKLNDDKGSEQFLTREKDGEFIVRCICEQCEQSLQKFPNYYSLKKWIQ